MTVDEAVVRLGAVTRALRDNEEWREDPDYGPVENGWMRYRFWENGEPTMNMCFGLANQPPAVVVRLDEM